MLGGDDAPMMSEMQLRSINERVGVLDSVLPSAMVECGRAVSGVGICRQD